MEKREFAINVSILSILIVIVVMLNYIDNQRYSKVAVAPKEKNIEDVITITELANDLEIVSKEEPKVEENTPIQVDPIVYDNMTMNELADKLNKSLHSDLTGTGYIYAKYSLEYGVDPYLAVAITLHETGCGSSCNDKVTVCNNVGGQKFSPSCYAGGSYGKYDTIEDGIKGFIFNLAKNYIQKGLTTPESMQGRYVGNTTSPWSAKVNRYIAKIKSA